MGRPPPAAMCTWMFLLLLLEACAVKYNKGLSCSRVTILSPRECEAFYPGVLTNNMLCAGLDQSQDPCQGGPREEEGHGMENHKEAGTPEPDARTQAPEVMQLGFVCALLSLLAGNSWADTRTIGAQECHPNSQPWQAGLFFRTHLFCGATLISDRWLLTAAHCYKPYLWVRLGEHHLWKWEGPEQLLRVTDFFPHPGFNQDLRAQDHNNDIMLIRLPRKARLGPAIQPLNISHTCVSPGTQCLISGWGAVSSPIVEYPLTLQCANISILEPRLCRRAYPGQISKRMLCAGLWEGGRGSCQGDSGGPLVCHGTLAGVVSGGSEPCSRPRRPAVYSSVCHYVRWIRKTMEEY